jgi:thiol-disulfide isomerase/thioredoxin
LVAIVARPVNSYRNLAAVAFDATGKRFSLKGRTIATHGDGVMERFFLEPAVLPFEKIAFLGFEALDLAGLERLSQAAIRLATAKGVEVLPLPKLGRPYEFTLSTTTGEVLRSTDLKGKVVLIDCWTSWCGPCKKLVPTLKDLHAKWRDQGVVIIGVNLDEEPEKAETAHKRDECPWPLVIVPGGEVRQLWTDASRIESVPRLLLIDANGILIKDYDAVPSDLSTVIADAMKAKTRSGAAPEKK